MQITVVFLADVHSALASEWPRVHREQQAWLKAKAEHDSAAKVLNHALCMLHILNCPPTCMKTTLYK
jgi:hypothetical protein